MLLGYIRSRIKKLTFPSVLSTKVLEARAKRRANLVRHRVVRARGALQRPARRIVARAPDTAPGADGRHRAESGRRRWDGGRGRVQVQTEAGAARRGRVAGAGHVAVGEGFAGAGGREVGSAVAFAGVFGAEVEGGGAERGAERRGHSVGVIGSAGESAGVDGVQVTA